MIGILGGSMNIEEIIKRIYRAKKRKQLTLEWLQQHFTLSERQTVFSQIYDPEIVQVLFSEEEVNTIIDGISDIRVPDVFRILTDEHKLDYIKRWATGVEQDYLQDLASLIEADEYKIKAASLLIDKYCRSMVLSTLTSDELKKKHLKGLSQECRATIIASMDDDSEKMKYIRFGEDIVTIIASLDSDELKQAYLKKMRLFLESDRARIIRSISSDAIKEEYLKTLRDDDCKFDVISTFSTDDLKLKHLQDMKDPYLQSDLLRRLSSDEGRIKAISYATDEGDFFFLVKNMEKDENIIPLLPKLSHEHQMEIFRDYLNPNLVFQNIMMLGNISSIQEVIGHLEVFPPYQENYQELINLYAKEYQFPLERMIHFVQLTSMQVLAHLENANFRSFLMLPEENYQQIIKLLMSQSNQLSESVLNDILNSLLQREFKSKNPDIILLFPNILQTISNSDIEGLIPLLKQLETKIPLSSLLQERQLSWEEFTNKLFHYDRDELTWLHDLVSKYILENRNQYIQENLESAKKKCLESTFEKNAFIKSALKTISKEEFMKCVSSLPSTIFTKEELSLIQNSQLLGKVFDYKKHPSQFEASQVRELKSYFKTFQSILNHLHERHLLDAWGDENVPVEYELPELDLSFILSIIGEMNSEKVSIFLQNNPENYQKLLDCLNKYKFIGWGDTFGEILSDIDLVFDASTVASMIEYFADFYPKLEEQVASGQISSISITGLIDMANCYGSDSYLYSLLFGKANYRYLSSNPRPNSASMKRYERIEKAKEYIKSMYDKKVITVPPIHKIYTLSNGKKIEVEVGNTIDMRNLTLGERTGACMRIGGAANDLFDFCLTNPNGFHITFTDPENGEFISRVSGFRNGNTVFLNQLRYSNSSKYANADLVECVKGVAKDTITYSSNSQFPVENVVSSSDFALSTESDKNIDLHVSDIKKGIGSFYSDVGPEALLLASNQPRNALAPVRLGKNRVMHYKPPRSTPKFVVCDHSIEGLDMLRHIEILNQFLNGVPFDEMTFLKRDNVQCFYIAEDWYAVLTKDGKLETYVVDCSDQDRIEAELEQAITQLQAQSAYQGGYQI